MAKHQNFWWLNHHRWVKLGVWDVLSLAIFSPKKMPPHLSAGQQSPSKALESTTGGASHPIIAGNLAKLRPIYRWFTHQIAGCPLYVKLPEWWKKQHISRILPYKQWLTQWLLSHLRTAHQNTAISCKRWYCIVINDIKNDFHQWPKKTKSDFHMTPHNLYNNMCAIKICINIYVYTHDYTWKPWPISIHDLPRLSMAMFHKQQIRGAAICQGLQPNVFIFTTRGHIGDGLLFGLDTT